MGNSIEDALSGLRFVTGVALLALLIIKCLFFGTRGLSRFIRPFAWTILLAVGLWYLREWRRPDFYKCESCGKEYTCVDENGRIPNGYCGATPTHKHHGAIVKRYDFARCVGQAIGWTLRDMKRVKWAFSTECAGPSEMPQNDG